MPRLEPLDRRRFLKGAAAAIAAPLVIPSSALGLGQPAPSERITVGHIGCGRKGGYRDVYFGSLLQECVGNPAARSLAVCDADRTLIASSKQYVDQQKPPAPQALPPAHARSNFLSVAAHPFRSALEKWTMNSMEMIRTPKKHDRLVLAPSYKKGAFDSHAVDCPFLFVHDGKFWMTYVGWDGIGYQTGLASSDDLLNWSKERLLLGRGPKGSVTEYNAALTCILRDNELFGPGTLKRVNGRFVGTYHAYPQPGYETGPAVIGLCYSDDLRSWDVCPPVLAPEPSCEWEAGGLYKSWLLETDGVYYLFYNAKNRTNGSWVEQTGFASSRDLMHWVRYRGNPVLRVGAKGDFDDRFASDPCVVRHEGVWIMFYFGLCSDGHARDGVAFSDDLRSWRKAGEILIDVGPDGSLDSRYAHKPGVISKNGRFFHFYCAAAPAKGKRVGEIEHNEVRGIAVATN